MMRGGGFFGRKARAVLFLNTRSTTRGESIAKIHAISHNTILTIFTYLLEVYSLRDLISKLVMKYPSFSSHLRFCPPYPRKLHIYSCSTENHNKRRTKGSLLRESGYIGRTDTDAKESKASSSPSPAPLRPYGLPSRVGRLEERERGGESVCRERRCWG